MQAKPKLYGDKGSQPVRAVLALLAIGRIDFEFVPVDLSSFETRSKEYRELNPFAHIPFLVDGKFKLSESSAILLYLCEKYPHLPKTLSGRTIEERAIINQYLSWYQNQFRPVFFEPIVLRMRFLLTGEAGIFTTACDEFNWARVEKTAKLLDRLLKIGGKRFLCGDQLSVADLLVYFEYTNLLIYERSYPDLKFIKQWADRMESIPEVAEVMKEFMEGLQGKKDSLMSVRPPPKPKL